MKHILTVNILLMLCNFSFAQQLSNLPAPIGAGDAEVWNNEIYHFGGSDNWSSTTIYPRIYKFNGTNWVYHDSIPDDNLWDVEAVLSGNHVYLFEGSPSGTGLNRKYNLLTGEWLYVSNSPNISVNYGLTSEAVDSVIYLFHPEGVVYAYNIIADSWETKSPNSVSGALELSSVKYQNEIYIRGWNNNAFYKYTPFSDQWTQLADVPIQVNACAMGIVNDRVYCIGGNDDGESGADYTTILTYNITANSWTTKPLQLNNKTHWSAVAEYMGGLYSIGGFDSTGQAINIVEQIVPQGTQQLTATTLTLNSGWNMVSIPIIALNFHKDYLFPDAVSSVFSYSAGQYSSEDTLQNGVGYWVKYGGVTSRVIKGFPLLTDTFDVTAGWNLTGSISNPVPVSQITSTPGGMIASQFFGYDLFYSNADTLIPGKAYWVKVNQSGQLNLSSTGLLASNRIRIVPTEDLPPPPPLTNEFETSPSEGDAPLSQNLDPRTFALQQNYPNPFNPVTVIGYRLPVDSYVTIKIYSVLGKEVATLVDGNQKAGLKSVEFNASNISSGLYFYRIMAGAYTETRNLLFIR